MRFDFGAARKAYRLHQHPRLFCDAADIVKIRRQVRTGLAKKLMNALRERVRPLVTAIEETQDMAGLVGHHTVRKDPRGILAVEGLTEIAAVGVIDEDPRAISAGIRALVALNTVGQQGPRDSYRLAYGSIGHIHVAYDLLANHMTPEEQRIFTTWAVEESIRGVVAELKKTNYLRKGGMNIPMVGMITASMGLLAVDGDPGVPDLEAERDELMRWFEASLFSMLGSEGYAHEDIGYGTGMTSYISVLVESLRRAGIYDAYTSCPRYLKFGAATLAFIQPWGKILSNTGDYGADFGPRSPLLPRIAAETGDDALRWLIGQVSYPIACSGPMDNSDRRRAWPELEINSEYQIPVDFYTLVTLEDLGKPVHPSKTKTPTQYMDPDRGIVTFRSSWKPDATFVVFDGAHRSAAAQGHQHDSGGHFSLSALGEYFAIDTGRYNVEQDQHNVVLVEGKSGHSTNGEWRHSFYQAALRGYSPGPFVDAAMVDTSHMSNCYWARRTLGLVKDTAGCGMPNYVWTVEDINFANDYREFWWTLNANPDHVIKLAKGHATVVGSDHGNCLDVFIGMPFPNAYPKPSLLSWDTHIQSCGSRGYIWKEPEVLAREYKELVGYQAWGPSFQRPRLVAKVSSYAGRFMSLMIPRKKGAPLPKVTRLDSMDNTLAMTIEASGVQDTIIWAYEHHLLEANGVVARGEWCVVRRNAKTGKVIDSAIHEGTRLVVDGKKLL
ncbi:MAG: hypothetical protein NTW19_23410 [Planctomycetota bacterium]|nr:hypothetical protein [Planctomycetota bacterium]